MKDSFLKKIIQSDSAESSKRFGFVWVLMLITLVTLVIVWKNPTERVILIGILITFASTLVGIGAYEKVKQSKSKENESKQVREPQGGSQE